ncbi:mitochondrial 54S ribosomal protein MRPL1 [Arthroderma uncinatum]|uniref:mitochondrial 54S ribosomal protein MRPL1 n=1 Tax=Arthroderma uncinatum TaxID=74035 RepID=UPI00144A59B2|nr:mitochondrial 54S ribosomal protein MRPL1 [Arthroderma uncinatum]KAF3479500.1 mitochondrial 54S ribosomal protein MRPL1 [Arthroderma uncinatum]
MAAAQRYLTPLSRGVLSASLRPQVASPSFICPLQQQYRYASKTARSKDGKPKKKKPMYTQYDTRDAIQFTLCDAMRYLRAYEAGRSTTSVKYEVHIKLRTKRDGTVIRNQIRLPHAVRSDLRVCVITTPDSRAAKEAKAAGADIVGEDEVFEAIKAGKIDFDVCICHTTSLANMNKAGLGRILGPKGLMPSTKMGTVVDNVAVTVRNMRAGSVYRERSGVVKLAIGQLGFSPEELRTNLSAFIAALKKDAAAISHQISKDIAEVVLSTTNGPGFSLNGDFKSESSPPTHELTGC